MRSFLFAALLSISISTSAYAQASPGAAAQASPEAVAQAYGDAVLQGDYATAARLMHPHALRQLFELFEPLLDGEMFEHIGPDLFSVPSRAEMARTADTTLFASFLRNAIGRQGDITDALRSSKTTIMGQVPRGADSTLVVARIEMTVEGVSISQFDVMPLARHEGEWRALLKADFTNMAAMMRRAMKPPKQPS